jgi:hypothetical protein
MFSVHYGCLHQINERVASYALHFAHVEKALASAKQLPKSTLYSAAQLFLYRREMRVHFGKMGGDVLWAGKFVSFYDLTEEIVKSLKSPTL